MGKRGKFSEILSFALILAGFCSCGNFNIKPIYPKKTKTIVNYQDGLSDLAKKNDQKGQKARQDQDRIDYQQAKNQNSPDQIGGSSSVDNPEIPLKDIYFLYGAEHLKLKNYFFDIPVVYNDSVKKWIHFFLNKGKDYFVRYSERAGRYAPILGKILEDHGLPRDLIFLAMAESGFVNQALSVAKAVGAWQFMPATAKTYGLKINWYVDERKDPIKSTIAAARYLKALYSFFGSWELAAAGYNAGEGKVHRAIKKYKTENFWDLRKEDYLKLETKNYLPKIMSLAIIGKNLESFGFKDIDFHLPLDFDEIDVPANTDLIEVANATGVALSELHRLNPELLRWMTPPNEPLYKLRLPVGAGSLWDVCCAGKHFPAIRYQTFVLTRPQTLAHVAHHLKMKLHILVDLNRVRPDKTLPKGTALLLPFREGQAWDDPMFADVYLQIKASTRERGRKGTRSRIQNMAPASS